MKAKEKAATLILDFQIQLPREMSYDEARKISKQCALICVEEMIHQMNAARTLNADATKDIAAIWMFWTDVKSEIEKLSPA